MRDIRFKRDTSFRKQFFVPDSFSHPAKLDAQLLIWIVEKFSKPGDVILDPMAGSGTLMLACTLGRDVVLVELEEKFCKMMRDNWEKVRQRPQLGSAMGRCEIVQGDARLAQTGAYTEVDSIITSPPYDEGTGHGRGSKASNEILETKKLYLHGVGSYSEDMENIGNMKGSSYLQAMYQVYQQCYSVLKPGGIMVLITKNFIRDRKLVRLDRDTVKLCRRAGFTFKELYRRKLPAQSFWRIIYKQKYPEAPEINHEDILVWVKEH